MPNFKPKRMHMNTGVAGLVAAALMVLILSGCLKNYGRFTLDGQVTQAFRSGSIQADYQYYYSGRQTMPYAIMAIDRRYSVPSKYWVPFEPQPEQLEKMSAVTFGVNRYQPYGAYIQDPGGTVIGVWYSGLRDQSVRVDPNQRTVEVLFTVPQRTSG